MPDTHMCLCLQPRGAETKDYGIVEALLGMAVSFFLFLSLLGEICIYINLYINLSILVAINDAINKCRQQDMPFPPKNCK